MIKLISAAAILAAVGTLLAPDAASAQTHPLPFTATFSGAAALSARRRPRSPAREMRPIWGGS